MIVIKLIICMALKGKNVKNTGFRHFFLAKC